MMPPRAFEVHTEQGSRFYMSLLPTHEYCGTQFGRLRVVGQSVMSGLQIDWTADGACAPEPGGEMIVDPTPLDSFEVEGEIIKVWRKETISNVREIPVPPEIAEKALAQARRRATPLFAE